MSEVERDRGRGREESLQNSWSSLAFSLHPKAPWDATIDSAIDSETQSVKIDLKNDFDLLQFNIPRILSKFKNEIYLSQFCPN